MELHYIVKESDAVVEAWSTTRLQFEPKFWQREFRNRLRAAISALTSGGQRLVAQYRSPVRDRCDTENILFYNVGTGIFAAASASGLRFERGYVVPDCPADLVGPPLHYQRYELVDDVGAEFQLWREHAELARIASASLPPLSASMKPAGVWLALHAASVQVLREGAWSDVFGLRVRLRLPSSSPAPVALLKPLLDGVVAAFSVYEGEQLTVVAQRIAAQLGIDPATISDFLTRSARALLGSGQLVVPRASGVQWQPADDRCTAFDLRVETTDAPSATLEGELLALTGR